MQLVGGFMGYIVRRPLDYYFVGSFLLDIKGECWIFRESSVGSRYWFASTTRVQYTITKKQRSLWQQNQIELEGIES